MIATDGRPPRLSIERRSSLSHPHLLVITPLLFRIGCPYHDCQKRWRLKKGDELRASSVHLREELVQWVLPSKEVRKEKEERGDQRGGRGEHISKKREGQLTAGQLALVNKQFGNT
eukprot:scaffold4846_cov152-Skeletonema_marinoi.AAC.17